MGKKRVDAPMVMKDPEVRSNALRVHPSQVAEANEAAKKLAGIAPFQEDGACVARRSEIKRYVEAINRERGDGEARLVNFDGGYGDPT